MRRQEMYKLACNTEHCASCASHLVNDATAWLPKANAVLGPSRGQEIVNLLVGLDGMLQISNSTIKALSAW